MATGAKPFELDMATGAKPFELDTATGAKPFDISDCDHLTPCELQDESIVFPDPQISCIAHCKFALFLHV